MGSRLIRVIFIPRYPVLSRTVPYYPVLIRRYLAHHAS